jgi:hypothetical protein
MNHALPARHFVRMGLVSLHQATNDHREHCADLRTAAARQPPEYGRTANG